VLLVINGAPAVGKSTLAHHYAREHALALVISTADEPTASYALLGAALRSRHE
jgi:hypothetical protein